MTAKEKIDEYIDKTRDWRGDLITEIRDVIHEIEPNIVEEWKWNSPVFSYNAKMICSPSAFKTHVRLNFFNGALIKDPKQLFNSGLDAKKSRAINFYEKDSMEKEALKSLITEAVKASK